VASSARIHSPVTLDRNGRVGGRRSVRSTRSRKASRMGSIIAEWKACEVCSRCVITPREASSDSTRAMASTVPDRTLEVVVFTLARSTEER
jgi:hypothetical protein